MGAFFNNFSFRKQAFDGNAAQLFHRKVTQCASQGSESCPYTINKYYISFTHNSSCDILVCSYNLFHPAVNMTLPETLCPIYGISAKAFLASRSCRNFLSMLQKKYRGLWMLNLKMAVEPGHLFIFAHR